MVTEMVMDCSLNHDNSNGSSASNAGSPRPPTASEGQSASTKAPGSLSPAGGGGPRSEQDLYPQRSPSPQHQQPLHAGGFDASALGRQHLGHLPSSAQLSPPMQSAMMHPRMHLGPPGLGLFNSLVQHAGHASPLEFMAAAQAQAQAQAHQHGHQGHAAGHPGHPGGLSHPGHAGGHPHQGGHPPRSYNSPPPISSSDPTANECKLVTYRGQKVAAFMISGETMLCLPQAFELFLKHLVGGLHTVYTKLKRLDIVPLVCNVEQVRILRGLGAIQPGVNRCKLLSCKDFDTLYRDCTTARCLTSHRTPDSRPGRPPKRVPMGLNLPASLQGHPQLKKPRIENGDFAPFENGPIGENRMEKSPLLSNGYNAPPTHLHPMHQFYHPGLPHPALKGQSAAPLEAIRTGIWEDCRAAYEDIVKHLERLRDGRGEADPRQTALGSQGEDFANGHSPVLNLSKGTAGSAASAASAGSRASAGSPAEHSDSEAGASDKDDDDDLNSNAEEEDDDKDTKPLARSPGSSPPPLPANLAHLTVGVGVAPLAGLGAGLGGGLGLAKASVGGDPRLTSTETILRNIEGLLQVAADNARQQERQINMEKAELKMDVMREREVKESLERQLQDETRTRVLCQKRLKKVRRASRRLQEQLELEMKRRSQLEEVLRTTGASSEALRILTEMKASSSASEMTSPRASPVERRPQSPAARPQSQPQASPAQAQARTAAFWQNYSENLAQELENERKAKQKQKEQQTTQQTTLEQQQQHRQQLMHDSEAIAMDLDSKPLVQDLRWPTEHRAAIIS